MHAVMFKFTILPWNTLISSHTTSKYSLSIPHTTIMYSPDTTDKDNRTPLDYALQENHTEVVEYLKSLSQSQTTQLPLQKCK